MVLLGAVFVLMSVGMVLVAIGTIRRNRWGINFNPLRSCPHCGAPLPLVRKPASSKQALWGGWTCQQCGTEIDKWGTPIQIGKLP